MMTQGSHSSDKPNNALHATASKLQTQHVPNPKEVADKVICSVAIATSMSQWSFPSAGRFHEAEWSPHTTM